MLLLALGSEFELMVCRTVVEARFEYLDIVTFEEFYDSWGIERAEHPPHTPKIGPNHLALSR
jgi:hypothetical protein